MKKGELLAPITNTQDANKIVKLFNNNVGKEHCTFATNVAYSYWIGLNITYNESKQEKIFSNGIQWNENKHSKIYTDYNTEYTDCPVAYYQPYAVNEPFSLVFESRTCEFSRLNKYVCFKPAKNNAAAESITLEKQSVENGIFLPIGVVGAAAIFICGVLVGVLSQKRKVENKKEENGKAQMSLVKNSSGTTNKGKEGNVQDCFSVV